MRINEAVRKAVIFLGIENDVGSFAPYGTAFIVFKSPNNFAFVITATHVLNDIRKTGRPLVCRVKRRADGAIVTYKLDIDSFRGHADKCDVSVASFPVAYDDFDFKAVHVPENILTREYIEENDVGAGDEVFTAGLLTNHVGTVDNLPIVRTGHIALMPQEQIELPKLEAQFAYLIESRSIGGLSGSPVFLKTPVFRRIRHEPKHMEGHYVEYLLGMHIGMLETRAHADRLRADEDDSREYLLETIAAGISIVIPIQRAIEVIERVFGQ